MRKSLRGRSYCGDCGHTGSTAVPGGTGCSCKPKPVITNLVFEGGGVKGIGYGGTLPEMDKMGLLNNVRRVAGTSAGAITACLLALGFPASTVATIILDTKFSSFQDDSFGFFRDAYRLITKYGWHKGDTFKEWLGGFIEEKLSRPNATFRDLFEYGRHNVEIKELYVIATNLTQQRAEEYSHMATPDMPIVEAVRRSMGIPFFFQCVKNKLGEIIVDGGVANNYPIKFFDKCYFNACSVTLGCNGHVNKETIGFRLDTREEIDTGWENTKTKISNITQYAAAIINYLMEVANKRHLTKKDLERTIFIETGNVKATDFDLKQSTIDRLLENGRMAVVKYFLQ